QLTEADIRIFEVVLADFSKRKEAHMYLSWPKRRVLILNDHSVEKSGMLWDAQLSSEFDRKGGKDLPLRLRRALQARNKRPIEFNDLKLAAKDVVVFHIKDEELGDSLGEFDKAYPNASGYVNAWLPGYSQDGKDAVLRFWFGPSAHGAISTYRLRKSG